MKLSNQRNRRIWNQNGLRTCKKTMGGGSEFLNHTQDKPKLHESGNAYVGIKYIAQITQTLF